MVIFNAVRPSLRAAPPGSATGMYTFSASAAKPHSMPPSAAVSYFHLPQDLAVIVRIERPHHARFLAAKQYLLAIRSVRKTGELPKS